LYVTGLSQAATSFLRAFWIKPCAGGGAARLGGERSFYGDIQGGLQETRQLRTM
jgi:hypothetical protein